MFKEEVFGVMEKIKLKNDQRIEKSRKKNKKGVI